MIAKCSGCEGGVGKGREDSYQDTKYGKYMRVHTEKPAKIKGEPTSGRCTICGQENQANNRN